MNATVQFKYTGMLVNTPPKYATPGSAGVDLQAAIGASITLCPMDRLLVPTGIILEIPEGYEGQVRPRSGLAFKHGVSVVNAPGTIDSDYRGEIGVLLINLGQTDFIINPLDRIAQLVIAPVTRATFILVSPNHELEITQRGAGGFGSTGA